MWKILSASAQGVKYFKDGRNNQDAVFGFADGEMAISVICDGSHAAINSEVVSKLSATFLVRKVKELLKDGLTLQELSGFLFNYYLEYLIDLVEAQCFLTKEEVSKFIYDSLLCTVIGVVVYKDQILLFDCGDGSYYLNNSVFLVKESANNRPTYFAYNLLKVYEILPEGAFELVDARDQKATQIPDKFDTLLLSSKEVNIVGIASDGLNNHPSIFDELRLHAKSQISLTLCLNRITMIREETTDNVTVSFLKKQEV